MMGAGTGEFKNRLTRSLVIGDTTFRNTTWKDTHSNLSREAGQYEGIRELELDVSIGELEIISHDESYIKVEADYDSKWQEISMTQNGNTLRVTSAFHVGYRLRNPVAGKVILYVPRGMEFDKADIELGIGDLYVENMQTREFELRVGVGRAIVDNLSTKELRLDAGTGEIDARNIQVEEGDIKAGIGSIYMKLLGGQKEYNYNINVGIGSVEIGNDRYSGLGREKEIDNGADKELDFECGIGNIEVTFVK